MRSGWAFLKSGTAGDPAGMSDQDTLPLQHVVCCSALKAANILAFYGAWRRPSIEMEKLMQTLVDASPIVRRAEIFTGPRGQVPDGPRCEFSMEVLVALYVRLRDEDDEAHLDMDPNGPSRAIIAMAVLEAGQAPAANSTNIEFVARRLIRKQAEECLSREMK